MRIAFCLLSMLSFFCFCAERKPAESRIEYEQIESDSGVAYVKRTFNGKNKLRIEERLNSDSVNHGDYSSYYRSSKPKVKGKYNKGLKHGTWLLYDTAGHLTAKQNWFEDKQFGEQFFYGANEQITDYYFMNLKGKPVYHAQFENGALVKSKGVPYYLAYIADSIKAGNEYALLIFFGLPPGLNYRISATEYLLPNREIVSTKDYSLMNDIAEGVFWGKRIEVSKIYSKPAIYEWKIGFEFYDEKKIVCTASDTIKIQVVAK